MIIISQDKNGILNFNNIQLCRINQEGIVYVFLNEYNSFKLGEYSTEERAKEVLQEIVKKYSSYLKLEGGPAILQGQMDIQPDIFNIPKVYEMPEE